MLHGFFPLAYLIYFLDPSIYPIKGPAVCDVVHQENSLREENTQSVSHVAGKLEGRCTWKTTAMPRT